MRNKQFTLIYQYRRCPDNYPRANWFPVRVRVRFRTRVRGNCPRTIQTDRAFWSFRTLIRMRNKNEVSYIIIFTWLSSTWPQDETHSNPCLRQEQMDVEHLLFSALHLHLTNWSRCDGAGSRSVMIDTLFVCLFNLFNVGVGIYKVYNIK